MVLLVALSGGSASISYKPASANTYSFDAVYQGDSNYVTGTTGVASVILTVNKLTPTVSAPTLSPVSPITLGGSVTALLTVTGSAGTPTGSITFQYSTDSGTTWNTLGAVKTLASGSATSIRMFHQLRVIISLEDSTVVTIIITLQQGMPLH